MNKNMLSKILIVLSLITPLAAADGSSLLTPGMGMNWFHEQSSDFQNLVSWVIGGVIFIVGAAYILFTAFSATSMHCEGTFGSQEAKAKHSNALIRNFAILILMIGVIEVGIQVFKWL